MAYLVAIAAVALALLVRFLVNDALPTGFPYLTFFPAVLLTAFFCGTGPGIVAAMLSVVAAWYWFIPPFNSFSLDYQSTIAVVFFVAILSADILIIHLMHSSLRRLKQEQARTAHLLERQHTLFEELQHRTANNMSFIGALLSMHKRRAAHSPEVKSVFEDAASRLESMARIHRRLYDPTNNDLPLGAYLEDLLRDVFESAGREDIAIDVRTNIGRLDVNRLITLSLLVSELATNSIKHAYMDRQGRFSILLEDQGDMICVTVRDDGPGFPAGFDPSASDRLGFRVLSSFVRNLDGKLDFRSENGALTIITFPSADPKAAATA
ncbi:sensor histidine kinase [Devosia chinhatensis]|uniref:sensor histidine kinase n=1 Tax=Devosia chinhatensis TaxID=429727 RepID=UPI000698E6AC|nr:DUF4118 domain-containing protein [Devosia chinhatensis]